MQRNICDVRGITCWGAHIGIKANRRDLTIIHSETPATAAAVFTRNIIKAAPITVSEKHVKDGIIQNIVCISGNANACTGKPGYQGAFATVEAAAESLGIERKKIFIAATGIIGQPYPTDKVVAGIRENMPKLTSRRVAGTFAANAILTTDTFAKEDFVAFDIDGIEIRMGGIAKGSGMIHPDMATMLAFLVCDVSISHRLLKKALGVAVDKSFNMITVDGDTSTNDCVAILCNGMAGNKTIVREDRNYERFKARLETICTTLAKMIVSDGEGATKIIEYRVLGAKSDSDARQILRTVSNSNLVKTAIFGQDPNWGRIIAAAGRAGIAFNPNSVNLYIGFNRDVQILKNSQPVDYNRATLKKIMRSTNLGVILDLHQGTGEATGWGSDLSYDYVRINAEYTT